MEIIFVEVSLWIYHRKIRKLKLSVISLNIIFYSFNSWRQITSLCLRKPLIQIFNKSPNNHTNTYNKDSQINNMKNKQNFLQVVKSHQTLVLFCHLNVIYDTILCSNSNNRTFNWRTNPFYITSDSYTSFITFFTGYIYM